MGQLVVFSSEQGHRFEIHLFRVNDQYVRLLCLSENGQTKQIARHSSKRSFDSPIKAFADGVHQLKRYPGDLEFLDVDVAGAPFVGFELASSALKSLRPCALKAA